jgi:two-component system sensor histidine kinase MtrB
MPEDTSSPRPPVPAGRPVDTRPVDTRPVDTRPVDTRPVDTRPVDTRPGEPRPPAVPSAVPADGDGTEPRRVRTHTRRRRRARIIAPVRRGIGLRTRLTLTYGLGAAMLAAVMSITTFGLTRENLMTQREESAEARAIANAARIASQLPNGADPAAVETVLNGLPKPEGAQPVLHYQGQWYATNTIDFGERAIPESLKAVVDGGQAARMRASYLDDPYLVTGVPIPSLTAEYYEGVSLSDLERTLDGLAISLLGASLLTTVAGGLVGFWASRRVFAPLLDVGQAAEAIAGGRLDTRLPVGGDPDLDLIAEPFNEMAQALEDRIDRDARFASEVSHELRSPLMTLSATVEVLENSRDEMPERARTALVLLSADVDRLQQLVEDLLEISRFDVGAIKLHLEEVLVAEMVIQAVSVLGGGGVPVRYDPDVGDVVVRVDKRRFGRVIANLLDNAERYAGGATAITVELADGGVQIAVEDRGNGVPDDERDIIFDRFSRGSEGGNRAADTGVGLGLALIDEHVRLHGGRVWVEDRRDGESGARFVVELPIVEPQTDEPDAEGVPA